MCRDREKPVRQRRISRARTRARQAGRVGRLAELEDTTTMSEEDQAAEEELLEVAKHLAAAPAEDVVANHCYGLFELAALHLSQQPPQFDKARLAIDALGLLVDGLGERLGQHAAALAEGLSQIRLAFVRISSATEASDGEKAPDGEA